MSHDLTEIVSNSAVERPIPCDVARWRSELEGSGFPGAVPDELFDSVRDDNTITRDMVFAYQDGDPVYLLVASMLWGFGPIAYGPYRTAQMLTHRDANQTVASIVDDIRSAARRSPAEGFGSLFSSRRTRLRQLGIAMGTKLLYFSAARHGGSRIPLVLDQVVFAACERVGIDAPDPRRYASSASYAAYCDEMAERAASLGIAPDELEMALFNWQQSS